jgi:predicted outer membrane repeat protein
MRVATILAGIVACCASPAFAFNVYKVDPFCPDASVYGTIQDAVNAAALHAGADYVWISDNTDINGYKNQHIVVNDPDDVIIEGGFFDCTDFDPGTDQTSVSGAGNDGGPVFDIIGTGHTVYLGNLIISGAQRGSGQSGGGINFTGHGELDIAQSFVFLNWADYGAGINVTASGGQAVVKLLHDTTVYLNTAAVSGGGIRLEGDARLLVLDPKVAINGNTAAQYGGGIEILGPARADVGAPDGGFGGSVIAANHAANGGGVAVLDNGNGEAVLRTFAHDGTHPTTFNQNTADVDGGAIYLTGLADACLFGARFTDNVAEDGAALYMTFYIADGSGDHNQNGGIYINDSGPNRLGAECGPESIAQLGGIKICTAEECSAFSGQATKHADKTPSAGAVIYLYLESLVASRFRIQDSTAAQVIYDGAAAILSTCLITDNAVSGGLIGSGADYSGYELQVRRCTIANNAIGGNHVIELGKSSYIALDYDIFDQPNKATASPPAGGATFEVSYTIAADSVGLPTSTNPSVIQGQPQFRDVANRDYHQLATSLGIDFAASSAESDLDGAPGNVDLPRIANRFGPTDLGAYERQYLCGMDTIFCSGFEY